MELSPDKNREHVLREAVAALRKAGVKSPVLDAAVLLGHATGESGPDALLRRSTSLSTDQASSYQSFIERRCRRETVSRIIGSREFYSRPFTVTDQVLDPRPDTELLVEEAIAWLTGAAGPVRVIDIGTGSGAIAVTVAAEVPATRVVATDISRGALRVAAANAAAHGVGDRVQFVLADLGDGLASGPVFDLLLSNPPYIAESELGELAEEVCEGDPFEALVAGPEGTEFYPPLAALATKLLRPGGRIMVEVGAGQAAEVSAAFRKAGLVQVRTVRDLGGIERVVAGAAGNA
ncbi:MAG: peptide chain release factor N(5)-glutamine methyltransferase [bacterium]|nr:peptide chain release factor N(5)-glutamine methyltransferase [bacterium]